MISLISYDDYHFNVMISLSSMLIVHMGWRSILRGVSFFRAGTRSEHFLPGRQFFSDPLFFSNKISDPLNFWHFFSHPLKCWPSAFRFSDPLFHRQKKIQTPYISRKENFRLSYFWWKRNICSHTLDFMAQFPRQFSHKWSGTSQYELQYRTRTRIWSLYSEFPPIFKNTSIELDDTGEMMHKICPCTNRKTGVRHSLVSGLFGENIVILADLIEEYLRIDITLCNLYHQPTMCFDWFRDIARWLMQVIHA